MKLTIIKYNAGNTKSVINALLRLGVEPVVSNDHDVIRASDKVIFPGVGEAGAAMRSLQENNLVEVIRDLKQPVLGICVGLQLLCKHSEESDTNGIGVFDCCVKRFVGDSKLKVPHMGWNNVFDKNNKVLGHFYFVHSYYAETCIDTWLTCDYGVKFSAGLKRANFTAVQFHTEKSADVGERLLGAWLKE